MDPTALYILGMTASLVVGLLTGWIAYRKLGQSKIASAEKYAEKIVQDAEKEAKTLKKSAILEAKDEWHKERIAFEKDTEAKRAEFRKQEERLAERARQLDRKVDILSNKEKASQLLERQLSTREKKLQAKEEELAALTKEQNTQLERIAGMSSEEAKKLLIANLENRARKEAAQRAKEIRDTAIAKSEKEAKEIIAMTIQRCAAEHTVESTVSVVSLPNDEMKGRIIGREGRNIRSFETATGIDVIVDDTPEAVILSGFDRIRREVARIALERLIEDGRIHPGRIEEVVEKARQEIQDTIREVGEQATFDVGVSGLHPKLIEQLGRLNYRTSYGQNVLQHSKEVAYLSGLMASMLELDAIGAKRAGLLHDIGKAVNHEGEGTHVDIGAELAKKHGENPMIVNAITAHHEDVIATSLIAVLVQAADTISGARPGARRETLEGYVKRLERLERLADSFEGVEKTYAIQAGREIRVMAASDQLDDAHAEQLASDIAQKIESEMEYPGQIRVTVIRETRAVDYAR